MHTDRGGRTVAAETVRKDIRRVMNRSAHQLSEAILAKALGGDTNAQLAAVQLLQVGNQPRPPSK